ncbi:MAG: hypothetical protein LBO73_02470 [Holosporaceae bacterium]|nr:hypothetical protein [Holosporaceae bacterium]
MENTNYIFSRILTGIKFLNQGERFRQKSILRGAFCCVLAISAFYSEARDKSCKECVRKEKSSVENYNSSAADFAGISVGAGLITGIRKTSAVASSKFCRGSGSVNSGICGGTVTLGYMYNVCGNFSIGVEAGVDFGSESGKVRIDRMVGVLSCPAGESSKSDVLRQMMQNISHSFYPGAFPANLNFPDEEIRVMDAGVWENFVRAVRYLGGAGSESEVEEFMTADASGNGVIGNCGQNLNPNAVFADFLDGNTIARITELGGGSLINGFREIRNVLTSEFPNLANAFRRMGGIDSTFGDLINAYEAFRLHDFFGYMRYFSLYGFDALGINSNESFNNVMDDAAAVFNPSSFSGSEVSDEKICEKLKSIMPPIKVSFGICPHIALKASYFFNEINTCLYAKVGAIQLNGHAIPQNNFFDVSKEKFSKVTPFAAVGIEKNIGNRWGISVEFSHAFKTTKRLRDITVFGRSMENRISVGRDCLRITAVYRFK